MAHITYVELFKFSNEYYCTMAKVGVHRANGRLEAFSERHIVSDELLFNIDERSPSLKSLTVTRSRGVTNEALGAIVDRCPDLELLHVSDYSNIVVNRALKAKCTRIETLELVTYHDDGDDWYQDTFSVNDDDYWIAS